MLIPQMLSGEFSLISFGIKAVDKANQGFNLGIYQAELLMDGN
jgi:hypothetical protein